jgi:radical SAM protein with 4Fe4S-binding SPASM domain
MASRMPVAAVLRALDNTDVIVPGLRSGLRKRVTSHFDYWLRDGQSAPPAQIDMKIIDACNLRCKMCAQWGENGYNFTRPSEQIKQTVPLEVYKRMVDDLAGVRPWVYIWGGEPFLYPDLVPLMSYMKEKRFAVSVVTNGTKLQKHIPKLVDIGLDVMMLSIDGPRETHDNIRGYKGAFDETVQAVRDIQAEKKRTGRTRPQVVLISVVTQDNEHNLEEVFELGEDLGADLMLVYYGWFQTPESGKRHTAVMEESLGVTPWSWRGWVWSVNEIDPDVVVRSVARIKSRNWKFPYVFVPDLKPEEVPLYYADHTKSFGHSKCVSPWVLTEIMPNGDVVTCRDYPDVVVGNIKEKSILELWNNDKMRGFRNLLKEEGGLLPVCTRCQGLMGW